MPVAQVVIRCNHNNQLLVFASTCNFIDLRVFCNQCFGYIVNADSVVDNGDDNALLIIGIVVGVVLFVCM
jgi:hypothetical protein